MANEKSLSHASQSDVPLNLTGQFIIATPNQNNDDFDRSVVYICEHNDSGALGIIINKTTDITISDILNKLDLGDERPTHYAKVSEPVMKGGPMQSERGFVLHSHAHEYAATLKINEQLALTSSRDVLEEVARGQGPEHMLLALGYSGWTAGQLEQEIARHAWIHVSASKHVLFETLPRERYNQAVRLLGVEASMLSPQTGRA